MKITKRMLKQLIKEEFADLYEAEGEDWETGTSRAMSVGQSTPDDPDPDQLGYSDEDYEDWRSSPEQRQKELARRRKAAMDKMHPIEKAGRAVIDTWAMKPITDRYLAATELNKTIELPDGNTIKVPVIPGEGPAKFRARVKQMMSDAASEGVPGAERRRAARTTVSEPLQESAGAMKITKRMLKQIIREELAEIM